MLADTEREQSKGDGVIIFKQVGEKQEVTVSIDGDSNLSEVYEAFIGFLHACGYGSDAIKDFFETGE